MLYNKFLKYVLDFLIASSVFFVLSPIFITVTILLLFANQGKPFFFQKRPGKNGRIFSIVKFKTMNDKKDQKGTLLNDENRLTKVGKLLRQTSLDEIPQLLNVIKGDMSLVGPRPLLVEYLPLYNPEQARRHEIKPGITGWAQVNGRNAISWEEKFRYDVWYVHNHSFSLDLKIIFLTFLKVIKSDGVSAKGMATTSKFKGSPSC